MIASRLRSKGGFTLAELLIGVTVSTIILAGLIGATIALQRSYKASEYYSQAAADQVRALDYIVRDTRGAISAVPSGTGDSLTLTLPAYYSAYDAEGNPAIGAVPVPPLVNGYNDTSYGITAGRMTVVYSVISGKLIRQVKVGAAAAAQSVIATDIDNFDFDFTAIDSTVTAKISFSPRFRSVAAATDLKTTRSAVIYMRNNK